MTLIPKYQKKNNLRILVTGGSGIIGHVLIDKLLEQGHSVFNLDRVAAPNGRLVEYRYDVTSYTMVKSAFDDCKPERVYHLAATVGREYSEHKPDVVSVNVLGTYNVARLCVDHKAELISFSTSEVYGNHNGNVVTEQSELRPINLYGSVKLAAENMINYLVLTYGLKAMIIRPFMIYGNEPDSQWRSALSRFFYGIKKDEPFNVYADCTRAWCYLTDLVEGVTLQFAQGVFNIGNDNEPVTLFELYTKMAGIAGKKGKAKLIRGKPNQITVAHKAASFEKARKVLGYDPKVSLIEGLTKTWEAM